MNEKDKLCKHEAGWVVENVCLYISNKGEVGGIGNRTAYGTRLKAICNLSNHGCKAKKYVYIKFGKAHIGKGFIEEKEAKRDE